MTKVFLLFWLSDICLPAPAFFGVQKATFWGMGARTRAHTPKCGGLTTGIPNEPLFYSRENELK
jgi:hypothetical protein